jgi:hypothetical protein
MLFYFYEAPGSGIRASALALLEPRVFLVNDVQPAFSPDDLAVHTALFQ